MKIVVKTPEPKPAPKVEPIVGGVYRLDHNGESVYRMIITVDGKLRGVDLSNGDAFLSENTVREFVASGEYVLVDAELHVKEA